MNRYTILDHTADIGIIVQGGDLAEVFANAAFAMFDILVELDNVDNKEERIINLSADSVDDLILKWLKELNYIYNFDEIIFKNFAIDDITETSISARAFGEKIDSNKHIIKTEIKAVTYHQLYVKKEGDKWTTQVIFDL
jgi:SHS2 domain-containing protein